jgi:hypothetical protein
MEILLRPKVCPEAFPIKASDQPGVGRVLIKAVPFSQVIESKFFDQPSNRFGNIPINDVGRRVSVLAA